MSIYGNTKRVNSNTFQFDRIYANRYEMDSALASGTDGVYAGRYVLVEYGERYRPATQEEISSNPNVQEVNNTHLIQREEFTLNAETDMTRYGVTYDSTVWQKIYVSDNSTFYTNTGTVSNVPLKQKFIMVAELNAITPRMVALSEDTYTYEFDASDQNKSLFVKDPTTDKYVRLYNTKETLNKLYFDQVQDTELTYYLHLPSTLELIAGQETIDYNEDGFNPYIYTAPKNTQSFIGWVPTFANQATAIRQNAQGRWLMNENAPLDDRQVNEKTLIMNLTAFGDAVGEIYNVLYGKASTEGGLRPYFSNRGMTIEEAEDLGSQFDMSASGNTIDTILANNSEGLAGVLGSILTEKNPYTGTSRFFLSADWTAEGDIWSNALNTNTPTILNKPRVIAENADLDYKYNYYIDRAKTKLNTTAAGGNRPPLTLDEIAANNFYVATNANGQVIRNNSYVPPITEEESLGHYRVRYGTTWTLEQIVTDESVASDDTTPVSGNPVYVELNLTHSVSSYKVQSVSEYTIPGDPEQLEGLEGIVGGILLRGHEDDTSQQVALKEFVYRSSLPAGQKWISAYNSTSNTNDNTTRFITGEASASSTTYAFSPISFNYSTVNNSSLKNIFQNAETDNLQSLKLYIHVKLNNKVTFPSLYQAYLYKISEGLVYTASTTISDIGSSRNVVFEFDILSYFTKLKQYGVLDDGGNVINFMAIGTTSNDTSSSSTGIFTIEDISYIASYGKQEVQEDDTYVTLLEAQGYAVPAGYSILGSQIIYQPGYSALTEGIFLPRGNNYSFTYQNTTNSIENEYLQGVAILPDTDYQFVIAKFSAGNCKNIIENKRRANTNLNLYVRVQVAGEMGPLMGQDVQMYLVSPAIDYIYTMDAKLITPQGPNYAAYYVFNLFDWINELITNGMYNELESNSLIGYLVLTSKSTAACSAAQPGYLRVLDISYNGEKYVNDNQELPITITTGIGDDLPANYSPMGSNVIYQSGSDTLLEGRFLHTNNISYFTYEETMNSLTTDGIIGAVENPQTTYQFVPLEMKVQDATNLLHVYNNNVGDVFLYVHVLYGNNFESLTHASRQVYLYNSSTDNIYQANSAYVGYSGRDVVYEFNLTNYLNNLQYYTNLNYEQSGTTLFYLAVIGKTNSNVDLETPDEIKILDITYG